ncbi:MAG: hypothetical protein WCT11_01475 [Candidatus Magasanikbacteria bacterium]|jgi:hypothetical protein
MSRKGEPFLTPEDLKIRAKVWKEDIGAEEKATADLSAVVDNVTNTMTLSNISALQNKTGEKAGSRFSPYGYQARRVEGGSVSGLRSIESSHQESFIKRVAELLETKKKVKILDIGGGAGLYAQQLRDTFGDKVDVFTTGIRKRNAKLVRQEVGQKLHKQDLKWRSVLQLSDYPEFDLIIDTFGESMYGMRNVNENGEYDTGLRIKDQEKYFSAVAKKLLPGGYASLFGTIDAMDYDPTFMKMIHRVENECGVTAKVYNSGMVKISKPLENK